jgi:hypothetical protein
MDRTAVGGGAVPDDGTRRVRPKARRANQQRPQCDLVLQPSKMEA